MKKVVFSAFFFIFIFTPVSPAKSYERIVSLAPSVTEILFEIGAGDRVVGVTTYCDYPEEAKSRPKVGGFTEHNLEAIVSQKPDLVILNPNRGTKFIYEELKQVNIESLVVPLYGLQDLIQAFQTIGEKTGRPEEGKKLQDRFYREMERVKAQSQGRPRKRIAFISWQTPLMLPGKGTIETDVIGLAGGENIAGDIDSHYPKIGMEAFFERDPDLIIDASSHGRDMSVEEKRTAIRTFWGQYSKLRAVKNGEVYMFKKNVYSVPGPRTIQLIQAVNALLDPETPEENPFYERVQL